jgi:hypothetical protein
MPMLIQESIEECGSNAVPDSDPDPKLCVVDTGSSYGTGIYLCKTLKLKVMVPVLLYI